jgi:hypothetical protein
VVRDYETPARSPARPSLDATGDDVRLHHACDALDGVDDPRYYPGPTHGGPFPTGGLRAGAETGCDKEEPCPTRRKRPGT